MYGKVIHGCLRSPRAEFQTEEEYIRAGYKPVEFAARPIPPSGFDCVVGWEEREKVIVQTWEIVETPISEDEALTRYANFLTGASDQTLIEAAETMCIKLSKED